MKMEYVTATLVYLTHLLQLSTQEDFIEHGHCRRFKTCMTGIWPTGRLRSRWKHWVMKDITQTETQNETEELLEIYTECPQWLEK
jgi:hypothetical protein